MKYQCGLAMFCKINSYNKGSNLFNLKKRCISICGWVKDHEVHVKDAIRFNVPTSLRRVCRVRAMCVVSISPSSASHSDREKRNVFIKIQPNPWKSFIYCARNQTANWIVGTSFWYLQFFFSRSKFKQQIQSFLLITITSSNSLVVINFCDNEAINQTMNLTLTKLPSNNTSSDSSLLSTSVCTSEIWDRRS